MLFFTLHARKVLEDLSTLKIFILPGSNEELVLAHGGMKVGLVSSKFLTTE